MGIVYRAWDRVSGAPVALKLLQDGTSRARFEREAATLARLDHPNLVGYVAHGAPLDREPWLAMEWLEGVSLEERLARGMLSLREILDLAGGVAAGLASAHAQGVVHRDLKPSNIFLVDGDAARAKVLDFGLGRALADSESLTKTGALMGTLEYMAPEQATDAKHVDARADVFSLGVILYEALTGTSPFEGDAVHEILTAVTTRELAPPSTVRAGVPLRLDALVLAMTTKEPQGRPRDAVAVVELLAELDLAFGHRARPALGAAVTDDTLTTVTEVMPCAADRRAGEMPAERRTRSGMQRRTVVMERASTVPASAPPPGMPVEEPSPSPSPSAKALTPRGARARPRASRTFAIALFVLGSLSLAGALGFAAGEGCAVPALQRPVPR